MVSLQWKEHEKKALKKVAAHVARLKQEKMMPTAREAIHAVVTEKKQVDDEKNKGVSHGQIDQKFISKHTAIRQSHSKTRVKRGAGHG